MAKITVNGEVQEVQSGISLTELIKQNNVEQPEMVSVQLNDDFVDRTEWDSLEIKEGDTVDFLYFMGGGQELDDWTITPLDNRRIIKS
ncbi:MAG: sulfur carrier protein ThiS [Prevotella sp.]|nr:sulfur carrier protein ThiS [Prevotella sp.]